MEKLLLNLSPLPPSAPPTKGKDILCSGLLADLKGPQHTHTFGSRSFQLLALSCCSSRNLRVTSSMESCRRSQKPARSWKVGTGNAVGS